MIHLQAAPPTPWPPGGAGAEAHEPMERALEELVQEDRWIDDFIKRLNHAIADIVREKP